MLFFGNVEGNFGFVFFKNLKVVFESWFCYFLNVEGNFGIVFSGMLGVILGLGFCNFFEC